jgi:hypothetical protein
LLDFISLYNKIFIRLKGAGEVASPAWRMLKEPAIKQVALLKPPEAVKAWLFNVKFFG